MITNTLKKIIATNNKADLIYYLENLNSKVKIDTIFEALYFSINHSLDIFCLIFNNEAINKKLNISYIIKILILHKNEEAFIYCINYAKKQKIYNIIIEENYDIIYLDNIDFYINLISENKNLFSINKISLHRLLEHYINLNNYDILINLLSFENANPTINKNTLIINAKDEKIINLLWRYKNVKETLIKDKKTLYDKLIKKDIANKIKSF